MPGQNPTPTHRKAIVWQSRLGLKTSYAIHSEEIVLQLDALGVEVMHRPTRWPVPSNITHPVTSAIAARPIRDDVPQISYDQADLFYLDHPGYKIGWTTLEVDGLPPDWVAACNRMDEVWTPTHWGAEVFRASGVTRPIHVMPLGFDPARFNARLPARPLRERYTFLSVFEWGERKAPEVLLRAYADAFSRADDVLLLLRVNNFDGDVDVPRQIAEMLLPPDHAPIALLYNQHLAAAELGSLYRSADCFVMPTHGEGWGMPILEAMACGLPAIVTDWSGQTEFMRPDIAYPLRSRGLIPAEAKCPYYVDLRWADPDPDHLVHLMRHVYQHRDEARAVGARAAETVAREWTWEQTARRIAARLEQIA